MTQASTSPIKEASGHPPTSASLFVVAVSMGLFAGLLELTALAIKKWVIGYPLYRSPQSVWMLPVAYTATFLVVVGAFWLVTRWTPRWRSVPAVAGVLGFLSAFGALMVFSVQFAGYARILLAAGIAAQIVRSTWARPARFVQVTRSAIPWMVALVVVLSLTVNVRRSVRERRAINALPAAAAGLPNVLLIILDTVRAASLSLYGYPRPTTPRLDALAGSGVVFDRAFVTAPWTRPSHASMFTGRFPYEMATDWNVPLSDRYPTLAEYLGGRGYLTTAFSANRNHGGLESGLPRGFQRYRVYRNNVGEMFALFALCKLLPAIVREQICHSKKLGRKSAAHVNGEFLRWVDQRDSRRPFFAFLNYMDAHSPYTPPEPYAAAFATTPRRTLSRKLRDALGFRPAGETSAVRMERWRRGRQDAYDGSIAYLDAYIGALHDSLEARGVLQNTLIIIASDHGEAFWEHGVAQHGLNLYVESLHVPLMMRFPNRLPAAVRVEESVSLRDLPATIVALLDATAEHAFPGNSLTHLLADDGQRPDYFVLSELDMLSGKRFRSVLQGSMHYIHTPSGDAEAYDLAVDPWERQNLAANVPGPVWEAFRDLIRVSLQPRGDRVPKGR